jgi:hypothetical protein
MLLLASDIAACRAFVGHCPGGIHRGGDCADVNIQGMRAVELDAGYCHVGTVGTLHESLPVRHACNRTVVRLNIPRY